MSKQRLPLTVILVLQVIAVILYSPNFLQLAPQAAVLPPALLLFMAIALAAMNSGGLSPIAGRNSLIFVQGINIVVRMMMFFPNLKNVEGSWNSLLLVMQIVSIGLSWYTMVQLEKYPPKQLLFKKSEQTN